MRGVRGVRGGGGGGCGLREMFGCEEGKGREGKGREGDDRGYAGINDCACQSDSSSIVSNVR